MYYDQDIIDHSPFFKAIRNQNIEAVELFCDHGADLSIKSQEGNAPLMYSAMQGFDRVCMYLSLRVQSIDQTDNKGKTIFMHYAEK